MSLYDDGKKNPALVALVAIASFISAWGGFEGYNILAKIDRVPTNSYVLIKDLQEKYVSRAEFEKISVALKEEVTKSADASQKFASCSSDLNGWQSSHAQWKSAAEMCGTNLSSARQNCSLQSEVRRIEIRRQELERDARTLSSPGTNGNPSDGISTNNRIKLETTLSAIGELDSRALEVTKRLSCQP